MSGAFAKYISVSGSETIDRLSAYLNLLGSGLEVGPTADNDVFAYRYLVSKPFLGIVPRKYDVEVADFPGEYTEDFSDGNSSNSYATGIFRKQFYSWVVRADRLLFTIDSAAYLESTIRGESGARDNHINKIEIQIKNAVLILKQELLDEKLYLRPSLLVFAKCDCFLANYLYESNPNGPLVETRYRNKEFDQAIVDIKTNEMVSTQLERMRQDFGSLILFLENNFKVTKTVFHSSYCQAGVFSDSNRAIVSFLSPL